MRVVLLVVAALITAAIVVWIGITRPAERRLGNAPWIPFLFIMLLSALMGAVIAGYAVWWWLTH